MVLGKRVVVVVVKVVDEVDVMLLILFDTI